MATTSVYFSLLRPKPKQELLIALITTILDTAAKLPGSDCLFTGVMSFANLGAADLVGANLIEVTLTGATLTGATLDGAIWNKQPALMAAKTMAFTMHGRTTKHGLIHT